MYQLLQPAAQPVVKSCTEITNGVPRCQTQGLFTGLFVLIRLLASMLQNVICLSPSRLHDIVGLALRIVEEVFCLTLPLGDTFLTEAVDQLLNT